MALSKELLPSAVSYDTHDEAPSRGAVDQQPIILDARSSTGSETSDSSSSEKLKEVVFSEVSKAERRSQRQRAGKARGRTEPSALSAVSGENGLGDRRRAPQYAHHGTTKSSAEWSSSTGSSTSRSTPPSLQLGAHARGHSRDIANESPGIKSDLQKTTPRQRDSGYSETSRVISGSDDFDDWDYGATDAANLRIRRRNGRYSFTPSELQELKTASRDVVERLEPTARPSRPETLRSEGLQQRRYTDTTSTLPEFSRYDEIQDRPAPLKPSAPSKEEPGITTPRVVSSSRKNSNQTHSPRTSASRVLAQGYSSSQSPRSSPTVPLHHWQPPSPVSPGPYIPRSVEQSPATSSRPGSRPSSRPASPLSSSQHSDYFDLSRTSRAPLVVPTSDRRARPTSKLVSSMRQDSVDSYHSDHRRGDAYSSPPTRAAKPLPYPDEPLLMPSADEHRYDPRQKHDSAVASFAVSRLPSRALSTPKDPATPRYEVPKRPSLGSRVVSDSTLLQPVRSVSVSEACNTTPGISAVAMPLNKGSTSAVWPSSPCLVPTEVPQPPPRMLDHYSSPLLPPCRRQSPSREYDDWWTLKGQSTFDICPECLYKIVGPSLYITSFEKQPIGHGFSRSTSCNFASPWLRLAWLLTHEQKRRNIDLLYSLARIQDKEDDCPGPNAEVRTWYVLPDRDGYPIDNFFICARDVRNIEALFPTLRGVFKRASTSIPKVPHYCDLRAQSYRFSIYLVKLQETHEDALEHRGRPSLRSLIKLVKKKASVRECTRDDIILDKEWHFHHSLPEFTVCEECYMDVVEPAARRGSKLSLRFSEVPRLIFDGYSRSKEGASCQLYSPRMREIFAKAVEKDDLEYLRKKALARKEVEIGLQGERTDIEHKIAVVSMGHDPAIVDPRAGAARSSSEFIRDLHRRLEGVVEDWKRWE